MLIAIKGAGDLATGIACRLHRCGFQIVCTDIEKPTTVRCTVAFSRAVYDGAATVTGVTARLAKDAADARRIIGEGEIPILIDPEYKEAKKLEPAVLVDAIIAKKNIGTKITDAPLVVGIGPGFTSGVDCHFCVESNRGHDMGRTLYEGSPEPDTATLAMWAGSAASALSAPPPMASGTRWSRSPMWWKRVSWWPMPGRSLSTPIWAALSAACCRRAPL